MHRRHIAAAGVLALGMMLPLTDGLAAELPGPGRYPPQAG